jgi:hypothetical protein
LKAGRGETIHGDVTLLEGNKFEFVHDLKKTPLPPFAEVVYRFGITYADKTVDSTADESFQYADNRSTWNQLQNKLVEINWKDGDPGFAQQALDAALDGLDGAQTFLPSISQPGSPTRVYIYPSAQEVQEALQLASYNWVAGHADPWLNSVLVSIPAGTGQKTELLRQIPHELMHVWLYQYTEKIGGNYLALPTWLNEGLATLVERAPNSAYPALLVENQAAGGLLRMASLCNRFPSDPSPAILAYAQSAAFTRYIHQNYGSSGLEKLVQIYADGLECERGVEEAFGITFAQLEQEWITDTFGQQTQPGNSFQATPFLILFGVILLIPVFVIVLRRYTSPTGQD